MCTNHRKGILQKKEFNRQWRISAFKSSSNPQNYEIFQGLQNILPSTFDISMYEGFLSLISRKNVPQKVKHEQKEMVSRACEVKIVEIYVYKTGTKISRPLVELEWKCHGRSAGINVREWRLSTAKTWPLVDMALAMVSGRQHPVFFLSGQLTNPTVNFSMHFPANALFPRWAEWCQGEKWPLRETWPFIQYAWPTHMPALINKCTFELDLVPEKRKKMTWLAEWR